MYSLCLPTHCSPRLPAHPPADSGRPKGFGFIEFVDVREAEEAIYQLDKSMFGGREIQVGAPHGTQLVCGVGRDGGGAAQRGVRSEGRADR